MASNEWQIDVLTRAIDGIVEDARDLALNQTAEAEALIRSGEWSMARRVLRGVIEDVFICEKWAEPER